MDGARPDMIGYVAGFLTTLAFVPQVVKSWRTRSVQDLSLGMLLAFGVGVALWDVYGVLTASRPIIVANSVTEALVALLLVLKYVHR